MYKLKQFVTVNKFVYLEKVSSSAIPRLIP